MELFAEFGGGDFFGVWEIYDIGAEFLELSFAFAEQLGAFPVISDEHSIELVFMVSGDFVLVVLWHDFVNVLDGADNFHAVLKWDDWCFILGLLDELVS